MPLSEAASASLAPVHWFITTWPAGVEMLKSELLLQTYSLAAKLDYNSTQFVRNGIKKYFSFNNDVGLECCKELQVEAQRISVMITWSNQWVA